MTSASHGVVTNARYGAGLYRRRIRLARAAGQVGAELEDDCHGFRLRLEHDGRRVTAISGEALRVPLNTCGGALKPLQALVGLALETPVAEIVAAVPPRGNCTHLFDLSLLALAHVSQAQAVRVYDVEVVDQADAQAPARAEVFLNGESIHRWQVAQMKIVEPLVHAGQPVLRGFSAWAGEAFAGLEREAAFVLSKGIFVACSRMFDMSGIGGQPALNHTNMLGACYSYSEGVVESAIRNHDTVRDFSATPEALLAFTGV